MTLLHSESGVVVTSDRLALVEGKDEVNLLKAMLSRWSIDALQVLDVGGIYSFKGGLEATLADARTSNVQLSAIGILRDADDDPALAFESISDTLYTLNLPVPQSPGSFVPGSPSVGVFILPNGASPGAIEELCWRSVSDTAAGRCSIKYVECLRTLDALMSPNEGKTLVHAYLAAQENPVVSVGVGAQKGYWPLDHSAFAEIKQFLENLASC